MLSLRKVQLIIDVLSNIYIYTYTYIYIYSLPKILIIKMMFIVLLKYIYA